MLIEVDKQNRNNYEGVEKDFKLAYNLLVSFGIVSLKEGRAAAPRCCKKQQQRYPRQPCTAVSSPTHPPIAKLPPWESLLLRGHPDMTCNNI